MHTTLDVYAHVYIHDFCTVHVHEGSGDLNCGIFWLISCTFPVVKYYFLFPVCIMYLGLLFVNVFS